MLRLKSSKTAEWRMLRDEEKLYQVVKPLGYFKNARYSSML
jgi:hypothetical protein